jgi:DNA-directed RNA polymerase specialized sigma24 family protein
VTRDHGWFRLTEDEGMNDDAPWAERALLAQERLAAVTKALASVGPRAEASLRLHSFDGNSQKEVAIQSGQPEYC